MYGSTGFAGTPPPPPQSHFRRFKAFHTFLSLSLLSFYDCRCQCLLSIPLITFSLFFVFSCYFLLLVSSSSVPSNGSGIQRGILEEFDRFPEWHWKNSRVGISHWMCLTRPLITRGSSVLYRASISSTTSVCFFRHDCCRAQKEEEEEVEEFVVFFR